MKSIFKRIRIFFSRILTGVLFIAALASIYYLFPKQGKFPYEYLKGTPWLHETLIAEFDFPILKSAATLESERDSLLADHKPYFALDETVRDIHLEAYKASFETIWPRFVEENSLSDVYSPGQLSSFEVRFMSKSLAALDSLYAKGILPDLSGFNEEIDLENGIGVVKNRIVEDRPPDLVVGPIDGYQNLKTILTDTSGMKGFDPLLALELFNTMGFNRFIVSNLTLDQETTDAVKKSLLSEMSSYRGMVLKGQRVIAKGELITSEKFTILESFRDSYERQTGDFRERFLVRAGQVMLILLCLLALFFFLRQYRKEVMQSNLKMTFVLLMLVLVVLAGSLAGKSSAVSIYLVPFVILPVIMRSFFDSRLALFIHLIAMLLVGFLVPNSFEFVFMQMLAGFAGIITLSHLHRRGQLVLTSSIVFVVYSLIYLSLSVLHDASLTSINWIDFGWLAGNGILLLFSYPLIYIFEKLFGFISDVTLIEISDSNHPLLRKLAEEAPGTFQHSMQVANLAESVVRVIGGNPLLVRAGAMYHDIGKSLNSSLFTENQVTGVNPHDDLERKESSRMIINHVIKGAEIARKHKLPKPIVDFILTHHGTTKTQYFLKMYAKENPESEFNQEEFAYPGPRPFSKETAVLMMADSVEAASRSLTDYSESSIRDLIDQIIDGQMKEAQFNEAEITFKDINQTKEIFLRKLVNIYHARIQYPK